MRIKLSTTAIAILIIVITFLSFFTFIIPPIFVIFYNRIPAGTL
jgi:hypothetical protein